MTDTKHRSILVLDRVDLAAKRERDDIQGCVAAFLGRLAPGSRRTMRGALDWIAMEFSRGTCRAETFPWPGLRYEHTSVIRERLAERYAPATANKMLSAVRGVLKEAWRLRQMDVEELHRACDIAPIKGSRQPKGRMLSDAEIVALEDGARCPRDRVLLATMVQCGLRRDEIARLTWNDVGLTTLGIRGKGNKHRDVPMPAPLAARIHALRGAYGMSSEVHERAFGVTGGRVWQIVREAAFAAGIVPVVTPHDLRRTYASKLLAAGVDLATVQRLMGHSNPKTTAGYDRRGMNAAAEAVNRVFA